MPHYAISCRSASHAPCRIDLRARAQEDDTAADVEVSLADGERHLLLGKLVDIQVNAGKSESESETFKLSEADRELWLGAGKHTVLRVTMTTRAN